MTVTYVEEFPIYRLSAGTRIPYLNFHLLQIRKAALRSWMHVQNFFGRHKVSGSLLFCTAPYVAVHAVDSIHTVTVMLSDGSIRI